MSRPDRPATDPPDRGLLLDPREGTGGANLVAAADLPRPPAVGRGLAPRAVAIGPRPPCGRLGQRPRHAPAPPDRPLLRPAARPGHAPARRLPDPARQRRPRRRRLAGRHRRALRPRRAAARHPLGRTRTDLEGGHNCIRSSLRDRPGITPALNDGDAGRSPTRSFKRRID